MDFLFPISDKFLDFIMAPPHFADFLEGTTKSGKTTVAAGVKFMLEVSRSPMKQHIIASRTKGTAEKNFINQVNGICDIHKGKAIYYPNGNRTSSMPHIEFEGKIIFVLGYDNQTTWKNVLGGQYGCALCDEMQTADPDFIRELFMRIKYFIGTLNPDDPRLPVYSEFINRARPYKKWERCVPESIMRELLGADPIKGYVYWFFTFEDNWSLTAEDIQALKERNPPGTKQYKNKILGLRGKATGLVFPMFKKEKNVINEVDLREMIDNGEITPRSFTCGVDTAYSSKSNDTIAFTYQMITTDRKLFILDEAVFNNKTLETPLAPSDVIPLLIKFLDKNRRQWGYTREVWIDSADPGTWQEAEKYNRMNNTPYLFREAAKQTKIIDRIKMMQSWMYTGYYIVCEHCKEHLLELQSYSWDEKQINTAEDRNNHTIDSACYGWLPLKWQIGKTRYDED